MSKPKTTSHPVGTNAALLVNRYNDGSMYGQILTIANGVVCLSPEHMRDLRDALNEILGETKDSQQ